ncbi:response regulator transcription factor [Pedobacter sp. AW1-32]|uniref:response regulator transcription factor n=1 Tax=Pedobacter sp. AW1-32 TaxID=3383026 RepID=UPI003FF0F485
MGKKVIVLEDDSSIREVIQLILEDENYEVEGFSDIQTFMAAYPTRSADLFLLDVMLPDGNGFDVCGKLKNGGLKNRVPVLMMSAHAKPAEMLTKCNADGFIAKPFDIQDLVVNVQKQMQLATAQNRNL